MAAEHHGVGLHLGVRVADALAQIKAGNQSRDAAGDVDDGAAGEIEAGETGVDVGGVEQAVNAPDHVGHGAIDNQRPEREEESHGAELHALGKGAGNERRGDDGEHELIDHQGLFGNGGGIVQVGRHGEALHHGAEDVLLADQAAVEQSQSGAGHEQDQGGRGQHPGVIAGVLSAGSSGLGLGTGGLGGIDGLLKGGDLSLGGRRRSGRGQVGRHSQGQGRESQEGREEDQFDSTMHRIQLPRGCRGPEPCDEAGNRPPIRMKR